MLNVLKYRIYRSFKLNGIVEVKKKAKNCMGLIILKIKQNEAFILHF